MILSMKKDAENNKMDINSQMAKVYGFKLEKTPVIENLVSAIRETCWIQDNVSSILSNNIWFERKKYEVELNSKWKKKILDIEYFRWIIDDIETYSKENGVNTKSGGFTA